jgi:hypothetical protein
MKRRGDMQARQGIIIAGLSVIVIALQISTAQPTFGACCVCTGCGAATQCASVGSCDVFELGQLMCSFGCSSTQCSGSTFTLDECSTLSECPRSAAPAVSAALQLIIAVSLLLVGLYYLRRRHGPPSVRAAVMTMTLLAGVGVLYAATQLRLGGGWHSTNQAGLSSGTSPRWTANLVHGEGNSLSGRVEVTGSSHLGGGNFQGHVDGNQVSGTLTDDTGALVATVVGSVHNGTFEGQYTAWDGSTGTFTWDSSAF